MEWSAFWSGLLGTTIPAFAVSVVMWWLNHRTNKALENHRDVLARRLSVLESELKKRAEMFSIWHQKRISALIEIYEAFRSYLDFLRRALYFPGTGTNIDPMWEFRTALDKNLVFLDDQLQEDVQRMAAELRGFWNWAHMQPRPSNPLDIDPVQDRLDNQIPGYLVKLRRTINQYADPVYSPAG